jgi:hypothetical protein
MRFLVFLSTVSNMSTFLNKSNFLNCSYLGAVCLFRQNVNLQNVMCARQPDIKNERRRFACVYSPELRQLQIVEKKQTI